jgi:glycosyltransferase involved in cell wall biosynthesis
LTVHGIRYRELALQPGLKNRLRQFMIGSFERDSIARARHLIAISPYVVNEFELIIRAQVYHLENPIDSRFFTLPNREKAHTVLFVGRIIPRKRAFDLVKAIARVRAHIPDVELRMAGDPVESQAPGYMQVIRDYVRTEGLTDHVRFLGQLREDGLLDEYATCAVVALPSRQETAPMAIQEAMAAGKVVVSTRVGGIPHLVDHNRTGLLVDDGDVDGLAAAITTLIQDAGMRRRMGDAGKAQAERRFHVDRVAARTREIYYGMLDQPVPVIETETLETRLR